MFGRVRSLLMSHRYACVYIYPLLNCVLFCYYAAASIMTETVLVRALN